MPTPTPTRSVLKVKTHGKAGNIRVQHNQMLVRVPKPAPGLKVKTHVKAGYPVWPKYSNTLSYRRLRLYHHPPFGLSPAPLSPILNVKRDGKA